MSFFRSYQVYVVEDKATGEIFIGKPHSIARAMGKSPTNVLYWIDKLTNGKYENPHVVVKKGMYILHGNKKEKTKKKKRS